MYVIYTDDEQPALDNFALTVADFKDIDDLQMFLTGEAALEWAKSHPVNVAFLDMEMPGIHGSELGKQLKETDRNIQIVYLTAYSDFALEAFGVGAIGYVLKPYFASDIRNELDKAASYRPRPERKIMIQTVPDFSITVEGKTLHLGREKTVELLALLVDRGARGITTQEGIACLWPDRPDDTKTKTLFRMTYKRLADTLAKQGIGGIIGVQGHRRYLKEDLVDCDLYRIMTGDTQAARRYAGEYLSEYSWAEERNAQLYHMLAR